MFQTLKNAWKIKDLQNKLLFTLLIIILYRLGAQIPVPYINSAVIEGLGQQFSGSILGYMDIMAGGALSQATLFALSVSPYITASIIIQLLSVAIPYFEKLSKDGEAGRKKINMWTRYVTIGLALLTSFGYMKLLDSYGYLVEGANWFAKLVIVASYCAGASLVMWLAEKINESGIGNGISMILFANIISSGPTLVASLWRIITSSSYPLVVGILLGIVILAIVLAIVVLVVLVTNSERKIPIQYAKRMVGRRMYGGQSSIIPLKVVSVGVLPLIFAYSFMAFPGTIIQLASKPTSGLYQWWMNNMSATSPLYMIVCALLIIAFTYFYSSISFQPDEMAKNIQQQGGAIPSVRPGKPTADYLKRINNRLILFAALFLAVLATLPNIITEAAKVNIPFAASSLLIAVSVALETKRQLDDMLVARNYDTLS